MYDQFRHVIDEPGQLRVVHFKPRQVDQFADDLKPDFNIDDSFAKTVLSCVRDHLRSQVSNYFRPVAIVFPPFLSRTSAEHTVLVGRSSIIKGWQDGALN